MQNSLVLNALSYIYGSTALKESTEGNSDDESDADDQIQTKMFTWMDIVSFRNRDLQLKVYVVSYGILNRNYP